MYRDGIPEPIDFIYFFTISSFVLCTEKKMENHISKCSNFIQQIFKELFLVCPMICLFNLLFQFKKLRCCECKCKACIWDIWYKHLTMICLPIWYHIWGLLYLLPVWSNLAQTWPTMLFQEYTKNSVPKQIF